jgi:glycosyltransferase involved in cell wall biosynthesis
MTTKQSELTVSVILPVVDEAHSLRQTVEILLADNPGSICEILIVICKFTTPAAIAVCDALRAEYPDIILVRAQTRPFLGGAMQDAFDWATGSHILMMASDLETDPATAKDLIARAAEGWDIVTANRWLTPGSFHGYAPLKHLLNWIFQRLMQTLYRTSLSDLTFGFRIFKSSWLAKIAWQELRHPFLLETVLKPLRLGARITEIPTTWSARAEGESHNTFWRNFEYFRVAVKVRFTSRDNLLRGPSRQLDASCNRAQPEQSLRSQRVRMSSEALVRTENSSPNKEPSKAGGLS